VIHFMQHDDDASRLTDIPAALPILPLRHTVVYPFLVLPLTLTEPHQSHSLTLPYTEIGCSVLSR
jgi:hypothetical protein